MKSNCSLILFFCLACFHLQVSAQVQLSTPLEILTFMEASPTQYEIEESATTIVARPDWETIPHGIYIELKDNKEYQLDYQNSETKKDKCWKEKAKELTRYENPDYAKARKYYQKILKRNPQNAQMQTLIGETYYNENNFAPAIAHFQKAIELNPIDYLARWLQAEVYWQQGDTTAAIRGITLAHLYNRNHARLTIRLQEIYAQANLIYQRNWGFVPQYQTQQEGELVIIKAQGVWLTYGMYKAVWKYEPDYVYIKSQQQVTDYLFNQEMEATIGTFMVYSNLQKEDKRVRYPALYAFGWCLDQELVEEYVMYEILLPRQPTIAYHITPSFMERIIHYIATIRSQSL